jgi:hypothetical protein
MRTEVSVVSQHVRLQWIILLRTQVLEREEIVLQRTLVAILVLSQEILCGCGPLAHPLRREGREDSLIGDRIGGIILEIKASQHLRFLLEESL